MQYTAQNEFETVINVCMMVVHSVTRRSARIAAIDKIKIVSGVEARIQLKKISSIPKNTGLKKNKKKKNVPKKVEKMSKQIDIIKVPSKSKDRISLTRESEVPYKEGFSFVCGIDEAGRG